MSPTKRTSTTKQTNRRSEAWLTTWQDTPGVRHLALAKHEDKDRFFVDVFLPCEGYVGGAYDNTGTDEPVTCFQCLHSRFKEECRAMNLQAIRHLEDDDLLDHFIDKDAMAIGFEP